MSELEGFLERTDSTLLQGLTVSELRKIEELGYRGVTGRGALKQFLEDQGGVNLRISGLIGEDLNDPLTKSRAIADFLRISDKNEKLILNFLQE